MGLLGFVVLQGAAAGFFFVRDMRGGAAHLRDALRELKRSEFRAAEAELTAARDVIARARARFGAPAFALPADVGPLQDDIAALRLLGDVAHDVAVAGLDFVNATGIDEPDDVYDAGTLDLEAVARVTAATAALEVDLERAAGRLGTIAGDGIGPIRRRVARTARLVTSTRATLVRARVFLEMVPAFAGAEGQKRYFVALQSPSEARGGGGLIGVYGILRVDAGRFDLTDVNTIETLVRRQRARLRQRDRDGRTVEVPGWFRAAYGPFGALEDWRQVNLSPNFPVTARLILDLYEADTGNRLDGVIALDPLALGELTRGTGPLVAPGWDRRITRESARRFLLHDIYRHFDFREREQNEYLNRLIEAFWDAIGSDDVRVGGLVRGLATATRTQHLKMYARAPVLGAQLADLGVTGDYGGNVQLLFHNNFAGNKVDYFLRRTVDTVVTLRADGGADVAVTIQLANEADDAPAGAAALVRPFDRALPFGTNRMLLGVITPEGSVPGTITRAGLRLVPITGSEGSFPLALQVVEIPAGETVEVVYRYRWPTAWIPEGSDTGTSATLCAGCPEELFRLTLWPQATVRADFFSVTVEPPPGMSLDGGSVYRLEGRLQAPVIVDLEIAPKVRS